MGGEGCFYHCENACITFYFVLKSVSVALPMQWTCQVFRTKANWAQLELCRKIIISIFELFLFQFPESGNRGKICARGRGTTLLPLPAPGFAASAVSRGGHRNSKRG